MSKAKPPEFDILPQVIYLGVYGSHAYGTSTPESDIDVRGILIPPQRFTFGPLKTFEQYEEKPNEDGTDAVIYGLKKFVSLAVSSNPSILDLLFLPEDCIWVVTPYVESLLAIRDSFLSIKAQNTYVGYATEQLRRIKSHRGWLLSPPKKQPSREDFDLSGSHIDIKKLKKAQDDIRLMGGDPMQVFGKEMDAERRYQNAMKHWKSYKKWEKERNPARKELEAKFGYDTKHATNLIRLLRMGIELVSTGILNVRRPDAEELLAIRNKGIWSYEQLEEYLDSMTIKIKSLDKSPLPEMPDYGLIEKVTVEIMERFWRAMG